MLQLAGNDYDPSTFAPTLPPPSFWQQVGDSLSASMHRAFVNLASFLPGILALLIAILIMTGVGALLSLLLRKVLTRLSFDDRLSRRTTASVSDFSPSSSPTLLISRIAFWGCVVLGFLLGVSALDASYSNSSQVSIFLLPYVAHSVGAVILLASGTILARFLSRSVLIGAVNAKLQYARFLSLGIKWLVLTLTGAMILDHLGIGGAIVELAFGILFGGIVLTLALAIGLGSRDIVSRSLERNADRIDPVTPKPPAAQTGNLRHF